MFGSVYTFDPIMNLSSQALSVLNEGKQRRERIKAAGIAALEAFYSRKRQPDAFDAQDLLTRVQAIPGCQSFDLDRLFTWFGRRRRQERQERQTNIFYPSLSPESIQHLKVLSQGVEQPNEELLATWAALLKANVEDIKTWIQDDMLHREETQEPFQMPTPHNSTSPDPLMLKCEPFQSPVLQHKENLVFNQKPDETDIKKVLLDVISATVEEELPSSNLPCTALEFNTLFSPYEEKMERIINSLS